jgi:malate dehydrogenase (oxaloacetate-decarboxylating)(NADP+)
MATESAPTGKRSTEEKLVPPLSNIFETEIKTAARVAKIVFDSNLACVERPADYEAFIRCHTYDPAYPDLI